MSVTIIFLAYAIGFVLGGGTALLATRKTRQLGREMGKAELLMVKYYDRPDRIYLGGDEPKTVYPGHVEVLWFPPSPNDAKAEEQQKS